MDDEHTLADLRDHGVANGDALVAVKQPFIGSVDRTAHDKFADYVNVKDFGA